MVRQQRGSGKDRRLTTPVLPLNREFQYYVTAVFKRGGESVTEYRKVDVGAGEYVVADFTRPPEENPIKLPAGPVDPNSVAPGDGNRYGVTGQAVRHILGRKVEVRVHPPSHAITGPAIDRRTGPVKRKDPFW